MSRPSRRGAGVALVLSATLGSAGATSGPALDYAVTCQGCHRADGTGTPGTVPALAGSVGRLLRVPGGREYLVRVPGVAQSALDDVALAALLNWMLHRFSAEELPPDFAPYTAEEVGHGRRRPLTDVDGARRALMEAIERQTPAATSR